MKKTKTPFKNNYLFSILYLQAIFSRTFLQNLVTPIGTEKQKTFSYIL